MNGQKLTYTFKLSGWTIFLMIHLIFANISIGGVYYDAVIYADDVALLAQCKAADVGCLWNICQRTQSSDPDSSESKTKCTYMVEICPMEG